MTHTLLLSHPTTFLVPLLGLLTATGYTLHSWGLGLAGILVALVYLTVVVTCILFALGLFPGTTGQGRGSATGATAIGLTTALAWAATASPASATTYTSLAAGSTHDGGNLATSLTGAVNGPIVAALLVALTALLLGLLEGGVGNRTTYTLPA